MLLNTITNANILNLPKLVRMLSIRPTVAYFNRPSFMNCEMQEIPCDLILTLFRSKFE